MVLFSANNFIPGNFYIVAYEMHGNIASWKVEITQDMKGQWCSPLPLSLVLGSAL